MQSRFIRFVDLSFFSLSRGCGRDWIEGDVIGSFQIEGRRGGGGSERRNSRSQISSMFIPFPHV